MDNLASVNREAALRQQEYKGRAEAARPFF
ncbi:hypothetical protein PATA110616_16015 [Paenibacillus tarimensis]